MAVPMELSIDAICQFLVINGGKVRNHDLVKHFKKLLTNPDTRDDARNYFKEIVNEVAVIRIEENEKFLVLRKKYRPADFFTSPVSSPTNSEMGSRMFFSTPAVSPPGNSPRQPPPYRPPPPADTPPVPPRRRSSTPKYESEEIVTTPQRRSLDDSNKSPPEWDQNIPAVMLEDADSEQKISVKERMQKFNRMASESDGPKLPVSPSKKRLDKDDDDCSSMTSLDPKRREWLVTAARGDYQTLAKLAAESPKLVRTKIVNYRRVTFPVASLDRSPYGEKESVEDPSTTALHWAAKHGNEHLVKMVTGTYGLNPNIRTNGGYTALHLAMQYEHEGIFNLLVQVYGADQNIRDWSGRKPRQYQISLDNAVSADTFRKIKARKKQAEKESGFLRMGSLNVRVKKTTEAFSNYFLGPSTEKIYKTWGSADNLNQGDRKIMPPPKYGQIRKRKSKREVDFSASRSTPGTPTQHRASAPPAPNSPSASYPNLDHPDSDSDTAAGFGSHWK